VTDVLLVAHHERAEAAALALAATQWLAAHGHRAWMSPEDARALELDHLAGEASPATAGLALSLGGDGTVLRTIEVLDGASVPIIAVNVGYLGYLTEVEPPGLTTALERWFAGEGGGWRIEERMLLDIALCRHGRTDPEPSWRALNEAVLEKRESGHTVRLLVRIDGAPFTSYAADGLIVATATGSTAYSLSARGPVVSPTHRAILLTPVSPHMLFDRSLVLEPDELVEVEVDGHRPVELSVDGRRVTTLEQGDVVACRGSSASARFVRFGPHRFHQILKAKFGLSDR
jgi:NAD+ kinase